MNSITDYMERRFVLRKVLSIVLLICVFGFFALLLNNNDAVIDANTDMIKVSEIDKILDQKAHNFTIIGYIFVGIISAAVIIIDFIFLRCPKCNKYQVNDFQPNFCSRCGIRFK